MKALLLLFVMLGLLTFGCCCAVSDLEEDNGYNYYDEEYYADSQNVPVDESH